MRVFLLIVGILVYIMIGMACKPIYNNKSRGNEGESSLGSQAVYTSKNPQRLSQAIDEFIGVPYELGGTTAQGMDCSGFTWRVYSKALNVNLPRTVVDQYKEYEEIEISDLQYGDLLFYNTRGDDAPDHVGIYIENDEFVHASTQRRRVLKDPMSLEYWKNRLVGARRVYDKMFEPGE